MSIRKMMESGNEQAAAPWAASTEVREGEGATIQTSGLPRSAGALEEYLETLGFSSAEWMQKPGTAVVQKDWEALRRVWDEDTGDFVTQVQPMRSSKVEVVPRSEHVNVDEIVDLIEHRAPRPAPLRQGGGTFGIAIADWQVSKMENPIRDLLDRVMDHIEAAIEKFKQSGCSRIHLAFLGDELEGIVSQGGQNMWRTTMTITEQVRVVRRMMLWCIDRAVDAGAESISVVAVPSNHGQAQRQPVSTRDDDDWSVEALRQVADGMLHNPGRYGHVTVHLPGEDETEVVVRMEGVVVGHCHGHKIPGFPQAKRVFDWLAGNALSGRPVGDSRLVLTGHGHHHQIAERSGRVWCMVPSMEAESVWWRNRTGDIGSPGIVTFEARDGEIQNLTRMTVRSTSGDVDF